jgi:5-methyltetrahydropteroyltriglutamate--homocysteine methyltransferase
MRLIPASAGSYPRIGDAPAAQRHRREYARRERNEISEAEWLAVEDEMTREVVAEQAAVGIELCTDGQIRWYDPISHLARSLGGVSINGLLRYFDTNFYFRQPVIRETLTRRGPIVTRDFEVARAAASGREVKPVLTGPYSLARGSIVEGGYRNRHALAHAYAEILAQEVADLARAGARLIQIDEPYVLQHPEDIDVVRDTFATLAAARGEARLACYTYFGDAAPVYEELSALPVDVLGLDFTYSPKLPHRIAEVGAPPHPKVLGLGLIDGRNTKLETAERVFPVLDRVLPRLGTTAYLNPTCGLEFLPRDRARAKLETLVRLATEYAGRRGGAST